MSNHDATSTKEQIRRLEAVVEEQARRLAALESAAAEAPASVLPALKRPTNRRQLMKLAGAAVVGAAGAAGAGALAPLSAAAADGSSLILGAAALNTEVTTTTLFTQQLAAATTIVVLDAVDRSGGFRVDGLVSQAQVGGIAGNFNAATFGAVGPDIAASGSGRIVQAAGVVAGSAPNFTPAANQIESIRGQDGSFWQSRATGGSPLGTGQAAWKRMNTVRVDKADGTGGAFVPVRVINTDPAIGPVVGGITGPLPNGVIATWTIAGSLGIPADAVGIVGNITAVSYTSGGFLTMFPAGTTLPVVSSLNVSQAGTVFAWGNHFTVGFGTGANAGKISIFIGLNSGSDTTHVVVDVFGYLQ